MKVSNNVVERHHVRLMSLVMRLHDSRKSSNASRRNTQIHGNYPMKRRHNHFPQLDDEDMYSVTGAHRHSPRRHYEQHTSTTFTILDSPHYCWSDFDTSTVFDFSHRSSASQSATHGHHKRSPHLPPSPKKDSILPRLTITGSRSLTSYRGG